MNMLITVALTLSLTQTPPSNSGAKVAPKAGQPAKQAQTNAKRSMSKRSQPKAARPAATRGKPKASSTRKKAAPRMAPEPCRRIIDGLVAALERPLKPLMAEARLGNKKDLERGAKAFTSVYEEARTSVEALRIEATTLQSELNDEERTRCEGYAYTAFHRLLTRFSAAAGAYAGRPELLRQIGTLFMPKEASPPTSK